jgi:hypothetical protein
MMIDATYTMATEFMDCFEFEILNSVSWWVEFSVNTILPVTFYD